MHGHADVVAILGGMYNGYPGFRAIIDAGRKDLAVAMRGSELLEHIARLEPARFGDRIAR